MLEKGYKEATEQKPVPTNRAMQRGKDLEPEALEIYHRTHDNIEILTVGFVTNPKYPNAGASPDGIVGDKLIEVKCFGADKHIRVSLGDIPPEVMAQVQMQMLICELDSCDLVLYNPDLEPKQAFKVINIPKDEVIHRNLIKHLEDGLTL
jgi:putative phage-type endonuclease